MIKIQETMIKQPASRFPCDLWRDLSPCQFSRRRRNGKSPSKCSWGDIGFKWEMIQLLEFVQPHLLMCGSKSCSQQLLWPIILGKQLLLVSRSYHKARSKLSKYVGLRVPIIFIHHDQSMALLQIGRIYLQGSQWVKFTPKPYVQQLHGEVPTCLLTVTFQ